MKFEEIISNHKILKAVKDAGYEEPTPIQVKAIPFVLAGHDMIGCAQTGTGKTAAFSIPVLERLSHGKQRGVIRSLILTPTRELAAQIEENIVQYGKYMDLKCAVIFGGVSQKPQEVKIKDCDILIATPGRLLDLMKQKLINLSKVEELVLDEADRMLDMGFLNDVKRIIRQIPEKRQTLLFSATMPDEIRKLANEFLHQPKRVEVAPVSSSVDLITQELYQVKKSDKRKLLLYLLQKEVQGSVLVFTRTKSNANRVVKFLDQNGIPSRAIHGNKSQNARVLALKSFKEGEVRVLVATDIAARGIDIDELSCVINYEIPNISETYVHRIGRTGRAGAKGRSISIVDEEERSYIRDIEKLMHKKILIKDVPEKLPNVKLNEKSSASSVKLPGKPRRKTNGETKGNKKKTPSAQAVKNTHHPKRKKTKTAAYPNTKEIAVHAIKKSERNQKLNKPKGSSRHA